jgi:hypothetical protein
MFKMYFIFNSCHLIIQYLYDYVYIFLIYTSFFDLLV